MGPGLDTKIMSSPLHLTGGNQAADEGVTICVGNTMGHRGPRNSQSTCSMSVLCAHLLSHVRLFETPWTVAHQTPLSMMDSPGKNSGVGKPFPSPGDLPNPGVEPASPALAGGFFTTSATWRAQHGAYLEKDIHRSSESHLWPLRPYPHPY